MSPDRHGLRDPIRHRDGRDPPADRTTTLDARRGTGGRGVAPQRSAAHRTGQTSEVRAVRRPHCTTPPYDLPTVLLPTVLLPNCLSQLAYQLAYQDGWHGLSSVVRWRLLGGRLSCRQPALEALHLLEESSQHLPLRRHRRVELLVPILSASSSSESSGGSSGDASAATALRSTSRVHRPMRVREAQTDRYAQRKQREAPSSKPHTRHGAHGNLLQVAIPRSSRAGHTLPQVLSPHWKVFGAEGQAVDGGAHLGGECALAVRQEDRVPSSRGKRKASKRKASKRKVRAASKRKVRAASKRKAAQFTQGT